MDAFPFGLIIAVSGAVILLVVVVLRTLGERQSRMAAICRKAVSHRTHACTAAGRGDEAGEEPGFPGSGPATCQGIEVHEHDSALGLADELFDAGGRQGAAHVLAEFARVSPRQAVAPWLRLMDVYRDAGARDEYEIIARGLHEHFNIRPPAWDAGEADKRAGIESYPHVIEKIVALWGTHACHEYFGKLLADNRGGSRTGFGIDALSDILLLADVAERISATAQRTPVTTDVAVLERRAA